MTTTARARKPSKPLERDVQKACKAILELYGWKVERRNTGAMSWVDRKGNDRLFAFGSKGASDLFGSIYCLDGRHFECEVKRPGERPTLDQVNWLLDADRWHVVAFWASSPEWCGQVAWHINAGGKIRYLDTKRTYPLTDKKGKKIGTIEGPSGDYELV